MSNRCDGFMQTTPIVCARNESCPRTKANAGRVDIRIFNPDRDSAASVASLLRRAYASRLDSDLQTHTADTAISEAIRHTTASECFIATRRGRMIATVAIGNPDAGSRVDHYRRHGIAVIHAEAVEPAWRGRGIGRSVLAFACRWLGTRGYSQLAIEIPLSSEILLNVHRRRGFRLVDVVLPEGGNGERAVLSRPILTGTASSSDYFVRAL
jgi:GNAT superfamily N-acetyltransferase